MPTPVFLWLVSISLRRGRQPGGLLPLKRTRPMPLSAASIEACAAKPGAVLSASTGCLSGP